MGGDEIVLIVDPEFTGEQFKAYFSLVAARIKEHFSDQPFQQRQKMANAQGKIERVPTWIDADGNAFAAPDSAVPDTQRMVLDRLGISVVFDDARVLTAAEIEQHPEEVHKRVIDLAADNAKQKVYAKGTVKTQADIATDMAQMDAAEQRRILVTAGIEHTFSPEDEAREMESALFRDIAGEQGKGAVQIPTESDLAFRRFVDRGIGVQSISEMSIAEIAAQGDIAILVATAVKFQASQEAIRDELRNAGIDEFISAQDKAAALNRIIDALALLNTHSNHYQDARHIAAQMPAGAARIAGYLHDIGKVGPPNANSHTHSTSP